MGKKYNNDNQSLVIKMIEIYKPVDFDWMGYQITRRNGLTFHHIVEKSKGGLTIIENGALITKKGHEILNEIYCLDKLLYDDWNQLFKIINERKMPPSLDLIEEAKILKRCSQSLIYCRKM